MTKDSPAPIPAHPARNLPHGDLGYLIGAAALVVVVGVLALVYGIVRPPARENLTNLTGPPGGIAWTEYNERDGCTDLMVAWPDGRVGSIVCPASLDRVVGWTGEGIVTVSYAENGERRDIRDPETGGVLESAPVLGYPEKPEGEDAYSDERVDGRLVVADGQGRSIWEVEADARYEIGAIVESPDGEWIALTDSAERLLVVRTDGLAEPVVWSTGVYEWTWIDLVWEGAEPPEG